jgi:protein TonB
MPAHFANAAALAAAAAPVPAADLAPPPTRPLPAPSPPAPPAAPPRMIPGTGTVSNADYPASALRAGEEGTAVVALDVRQDGRVGFCRVTRSSGSAALDAASCRLMIERPRFEPPRDASGNPTVAVVGRAIRWSLNRRRGRR